MVDPGARARISAAMDALWEGARERTEQQVLAIEHGVVAVLEGRLDEETRLAAQQRAHQIAGTAGTFGFLRATHVARDLERFFENPPADAAQASRAAGMLQDLRSAIARRDEVSADQRIGPPLGPATSPPERLPDEAGAGDDSGPADTTVVLVLLTAASPASAEGLLAHARARGLVPEIVDPGGLGSRLESSGPPAAAALVQLAADRLEECVESVRVLDRHGVPAVVLLPEGADTGVRLAAVRAGARLLLNPPFDSPGTWAQVADSVATLFVGDPAGYQIMAVDDDETVLHVIQELLGSQAGTRVATLSRPERFWSELNRVEPDLVLLDIEMPGVNGLDLCRAVRSDPRWRQLPIVILSGRVDPGTLQRVYGVGADDFVTKPIIGPELRARIANRLERTRLHRLLAETDALTGLPNRRRLELDLRRLQKLAERYHVGLCVAVVDVDRFKRVNDRYGHAVGDSVLRSFGLHLQDSFRGEDVVARLGGEEFVIGMIGIDRADAVHRLGSVLAAFGRTQLVVDEHRLRVGASAGVAQYGADGDDFGTLYRAADEALRRAKATGRGKVLAAGTPDLGSAETVDVAIVEGDEVVAELLRHTLATAGYGCAVLPDAAQAVRRLTGGEHALRAGAVLVDIDRPGLAGAEVLPALHRAGVTASSAVLVVGTEEAAAGLLPAGVADVMSSPFTVPRLVERLHRLLGDDGR